MPITYRPIRFINLEERFPIEYNEEFSIEQASLSEIIDKVASFVSEVYAKFLAFDAAQRTVFCQSGMSFGALLSPSPPSNGEIALFKYILKQKIITSLSQEEESECNISLTTDDFPENSLLEVCNSSFQNTNQLGGLFPFKTFTHINLRDNKTVLFLRINFRT